MLVDSTHPVLFDESPVPMYVFDAATLAFVAVNRAALALYGYTREEFLSMRLHDLKLPEDVPKMVRGIANQPSAPWAGTVTQRTKAGVVLTVEISGFPSADGRTRLAAVRDVTERVRMEEQLRQALKMEAVGRLAGGIAHDFNNVLSVVLTYAELAQTGLAPNDPLRADLEEMRKAGLRAADLTRQLLVFSRHQAVVPRVLDVGTVLAGLEKMLRRIVGEDVALATQVATSLGAVRADPSHVEQVIMNLVVNARDAMPRGGRLTIEASNVDLGEDFARTHLDAQAGPHVLLAISDTGVGMDKETAARIFEPFFTTKTKGTGLGLSTVFGIVRQSGGTIWVYSEPGRGTTFKVYFPRVDEEPEPASTRSSLVDLRGSETVLVAEDDDQVRAVVLGILGRYGYRVIEACNAGEALLACEGHEGQIDLLLSDVVMPRVSGPELATRLQRMRPGLKVLCMSGYTDDAIVRHGVLSPGVAFVQKPVTPESLARRVREVLDGA